MTDYLTVKYNAELSAIQGREAAALEAALTIYAKAVKEITDKAAAERLEAGVADAAARSQRDHEYHNGRSEPAEIATPQPDNTAPAPDSYDPTSPGTIEDRVDPNADRE